MAGLLRDGAHGRARISGLKKLVPGRLDNTLAHFLF